MLSASAAVLLSVGRFPISVPALFPAIRKLPYVFGTYNFLGQLS